MTDVNVVTLTGTVVENGSVRRPRPNTEILEVDLRTVDYTGKITLTPIRVVNPSRIQRGCLAPNQRITVIGSVGRSFFKDGSGDVQSRTWVYAVRVTKAVT